MNNEEIVIAGQRPKSRVVAGRDRGSPIWVKPGIYEGLDDDIRHSPVELANTEFRQAYRSKGVNRLRLRRFQPISFGPFATSP